MGSAVLSIEQGDDSGEPLELTTDAIAEKFVQYYWRQVVPYARAGEAAILQQNTDRHAAIVNLVREAHASHGGSLAAAMHDLARGLPDKQANNRDGFVAAVGLTAHSAI